MDGRRNSHGHPRRPLGELAESALKSYVLFSGFLLFFFCLALHVILWRRRRPGHHILSLLTIFLVPLAVFAILFLTGWFGSKPGIDLIAIGLLHLAMTAAYIQTYPAIYAISPSLRIALLVHGSMPAGMTQEEIFGRFDSKELLEDRIQDLVDARLVHQTDGNLRLARKGTIAIVPFVILRKILGLEVGRG